MFTIRDRNLYVLKKNSFAHVIQCYHNFLKKSMPILQMWLDFLTIENKTAENMLQKASLPLLKSIHRQCDTELAATFRQILHIDHSIAAVNDLFDQRQAQSIALLLM